MDGCYPSILSGICACLSLLPSFFPHVPLIVFTLFSEPKGGIFYSWRSWSLSLFISWARSWLSLSLCGGLHKLCPPPFFLSSIHLLQVLVLSPIKTGIRVGFRQLNSIFLLSHRGRGELEVHHTCFTFLGTQQSHLS